MAEKNVKLKDGADVLYPQPCIATNSRVGGIKKGTSVSISGDGTLNVVSAQNDTAGIATFKQIINIIYPINSIIIRSDNVNPGTQFPGTTWVPFAQGRTLLGAGSNEANSPNDYTAKYGKLEANVINRPIGEKGGEAKHKLDLNEMPQHDHGGLVSETNKVTKYQGGSSMGSETVHVVSLQTKETTKTSESFAHTGPYPTGSVPTKQYVFNPEFAKPQGNDYEHNNMPPYIVVTFWKRTA